MVAEQDKEIENENDEYVCDGCNCECDDCRCLDREYEWCDCGVEEE